MAIKTMEWIIVGEQGSAYLFVINNFESCISRLGMTAANKLQELRMWTRAGLEYAITHHEVRKKRYAAGPGSVNQLKIVKKIM